tara:strand:- start:3756 stop:4481 length:726 start_codon:yes stop_codon:yes gene_type:complete
MFKQLFYTISPEGYYKFTSMIIPWFLLLALLLITYGLYLGLFVAPPDYQQGDAFRIMYVHVPSAWISLFAYSIVFLSALISLIWHIKVYDTILLASCKLGALFTLFTLVTGAIWGKPMWGTWWAWDARLTSELILFFIYISILLLHGSFEDNRKATTSVNILAIVGFINIPIIHFSVEWWNTLHQGPSVIKLSTPSIAGEMLSPLIITAIGFTLFFLGAMFKSSQNTLLENEKNKSWTKLI